MNREKLINVIMSNYSFFHFCSNMYNHVSFKNRLRSKGCRLSAGISRFEGLRILNYGSDNEVIIGDRVRINNSTIIIHGDHNRISIGDHAFLNQVELYMEDSHNEISIGKHTSFWGTSQFAAIEGTKIMIGDHCMFSNDLHFRTGDSHSILNMKGERINPSKDIVIEDHVWVGTRVTCLKGVRVSRNSIVAATTTLCKDYDTENVIIGGVPGKVIKADVNWDSDRI